VGRHWFLPSALAIVLSAPCGPEQDSNLHLSAILCQCLVHLERYPRRGNGNRTHVSDLSAWPDSNGRPPEPQSGALDQLCHRLWRRDWRHEPPIDISPVPSRSYFKRRWEESNSRSRCWKPRHYHYTTPTMFVLFIHPALATRQHADCLIPLERLELPNHAFEAHCLDPLGHRGLSGTDGT
jgi:hypothetical protein